MRAAVVGLGKIGLPLAVQVALSGIAVVGADRDASVVEKVNSGSPPFAGEPDLEEWLADAVEAGSLSATISTSHAVGDADVILVVVPLVVDEFGVPDFESIDAATEEIGLALRPGQTVIYETTLPIGTTRDRFGSALERASGLCVGQDFFLCFSPERVSSGSVFHDFRSYPKIVGGVDAPSASAAEAFYTRVLDFDPRPDLSRPNGVWVMESTEAAEFVKLAETTYRDINIALANEFAEHAEHLGVDFGSVRLAANSQPYSHVHRPGIAVGGHCIPVYPQFYLRTHTNAVLPAGARIINRAQPARAVERLESEMGSLSGLTIAVLGVAYRGGVKESAFSGVFDIVRELEAKGADARVNDPLYDVEELIALGFRNYELGTSVDGAIVQTDHTEYELLCPDDLPGCQVLLDGRGIVRCDEWQRSLSRLLAIGRPSSVAGQ